MQPNEKGVKPAKQKQAAEVPKTEVPKSTNALREERILAFWKEKGIFEKSLEKTKKGDEFVFYEGPPTANGRPGIHHLEARAFKDAIPRYKTMRGYHVRRKGGWDTHGLPVELQVEKELGLKSKKEIDTYGIAAFNEKCKESVWTYVHEWEQFTDRMGYWVDLKHPYITYKPDYIEALWNIVKKIDGEHLLYKDYKVVPWCPRCGTALSSHELAQGYETVKDLSVYVKFKLKNSSVRSLGGQPTATGGHAANAFILAWTTTPWTLPGNVGLAVGEKIEYVRIRLSSASMTSDSDQDGLADTKKSPAAMTPAAMTPAAMTPAAMTPEQPPIVAEYILAKERLSILKDLKYETVSTFKGKDLVGLEYEPLYPFLGEAVANATNEAEKEKLKNAFKVYPADFVTTEDGTGVVHTAVMYGEDDFELGTRVGLPKYHLVYEDGTFKPEVGFLAGKFVRDEATAVLIVKDLAHRGLLFAKEKYEHSYPHCWRCHTPLIYFARDSWYIRMSELRYKLVKENEGIHWEPEHIQKGRFGEWLREVKDWAISRERYWGTPLPVWICEKCGKRHVVGSVEEIARKPRNSYYVMRHGEAEFNVKQVLSSDADAPNHLTELGKKKIAEHASSLKECDVDLIIASPFVRTQETARIVQGILGLADDAVVTEPHIGEMGFGSWNGLSLEKFMALFPMSAARFEANASGVEDYAKLKKRMGDFLYGLEEKYSGRTILIVTHGSPAMMLMAAAQGWDRKQTIAYETDHYLQKGHFRKLDFAAIPHNTEYELDLHRPYIDEVKLPCSCGGQMSRVKEVMDVWFDSGAMPFAQDHVIQRTANAEQRGDQPKEVGRLSLASIFHKSHNYPADFISEAIDQTRGWFYTLHAIGVLMGKGRAYNNVICLGHILDPEGKKMSKSVGNIVSPWEMMDKYGADALRFWMYSVNQPGESKDFEEKTVDEVVKKVFNLAANVLSFYKMYEAEKNAPAKTDVHHVRNLKEDYSVSKQRSVLDQWIISRLNQLTATVTKGLDSYIFLEPTRAIRDFVGDLSQWYLRRSRDRFKGDNFGDRQAALATTKEVLLSLARLMAPFAPFFAEELYLEAGGALESVHLETWPVEGKVDEEVLTGMQFVRSIATMALMQRTQAKIPVRQPLSLLSIKHGGKPPAFWTDQWETILKDEINVEAIEFDPAMSEDEPAVMLDINITPELKEKGDLRELLRKIQDLRKDAGLSVKDGARVILPESFRALAEKYGDAIRKATNVSGIAFGAEFSVAKNDLADNS